MNNFSASLYQPGTSFLHQLNARTKLIDFFILVVAVIAAHTFSSYGLLIALTLFLMRLSQIPYLMILRQFRRMFCFFFLILLMNTCFSNPENAWISFWIFTPSYAGLIQGINTVIRVSLLLIIGNLLILTTAPLELTMALQAMLMPLYYLHIPTGQIAMILSVAIQFIPTLFGETDAIRRAQTARGARFDSPKFREKAAAILPLLIPVFLSAFKRADELALAMEARGYRITRHKPNKRKKRLKVSDYISLVFCLSLCVLVFICNIFLQ